jgi:hypothetical protein
MKTNRLNFGVCILALAVSSPAFAADTTLAAKDATGTTKNLRVQDDAAVLTPSHTVRCVASPTTDCIAEVHASAGSDATKAVSIQGIQGGKALAVAQSGTWTIAGLSGTVSLPTGAATAAKQPAIGSAGSASTEVLTVQGIASGTNLNVNCQVGCSGGTSYTEDAAAAADPVGLSIISRRRDTMTTAEVSTDGDNIALISTNKGELRINDNSLNTAIGTTADAAWASGNGSAIAFLKTIATASLDTTPISSNITQLNGVTLLTGNGVTGTGSQRVTIASDNTNIPIVCNSGCSGGTQYAEDAVAASGNTGTLALVQQVASPSDLAADGDYAVLQMKGGKLFVDNSANNQPIIGFAGTATTTITRPADTTAYTANDAFADSASSPTSGGFTLTGMCRISGGSGVLTDATLVYSTSVAVSGVVYLYDSAPTAQNDNAAWSVSDADQLKLVGTITFNTVADGANAIDHEKNLNIGYTCSGATTLRYMVKITTGYTPAASDTLTLRAKFIQSN